MTTLDLSISGMTCASCAGRIERRLNGLAGVHATVNLATERASVDHPDSVSTQDIVTAVEEAGYHAAVPGPDASAGGPDPSLRRRMLVSLALTLPVVVIAMVRPAHFPGWAWVVLLLTAPVVGWGAWPFHRAALAGARHRTSTMDTLISIGVTATFTWSVYATVAGDDTYFEVGAVVTTFVLIGRYAEAGARRRSGAALRTLLSLGAKDVTVLRDGIESREPVDRLAVGDEFVVRPGETVAADGAVVGGHSAVDASTFTGEPVPVEVGPGDPVLGASVNGSGRLVVRADRVGADTQLARIGRLVAAAQAGTAPVQRLADRVSALFVPVVLIVALGTLLTWLLLGHGVGAALSATAAVLVVACPCALGLATPTALLVGTGRGAQLGLLIRGPEVLEATRRVDTIVLDKTGTVTTGRMALIDVVPAPGVDRGELLRLAGAVESGSEHAIGRAVAAGVDGPEAVDFAATPGQGVRALVAGREVRAGRLSYVGGPATGKLVAAADAAEAAGRTAVWVGWGGQPTGVLVVSDTVRADSAAAVARFRELGLRPVLLTGDNRRAALAVAAEVGIAADDVVAEVLPAGKVDAVRERQRAGRVVAMVGDGVNDAAALAAADLGLALGSGADVAIEAGDITVVRGDLPAAVDAIRLARRTLRTIRGNLGWAFGYNVAALPLAAAGRLNPMIAGAAMAFSSVLVVTNSLRLRRFR